MVIYGMINCRKPLFKQNYLIFKKTLFSKSLNQSHSKITQAANFYIVVYTVHFFI